MKKNILIVTMFLFSSLIFAAWFPVVKCYRSDFSGPSVVFDVKGGGICQIVVNHPYLKRDIYSKFGFRENQKGEIIIRCEVRTISDTNWERKIVGQWGPKAGIGIQLNKKEFFMYNRRQTYITLTMEHCEYDLSKFPSHSFLD